MRRDNNRKNGTKKWMMNRTRPEFPVAASAPCEIPRDLFWEVTGPDNQPLRKCHVDPQHVEGKQQLAIVIIVSRHENALHRLRCHEPAPKQ